MIVVAFRGGLGNQMFQYAMGIALSEEYTVDVLFDLTHLKADSKGIYTQRNYELDVFDLKINFAEEVLLQKFNKNKLERMLGIRSDYIVLSDNKPNFELLRTHHVYLDGYWQSENYFSKHKQKIIDSFKPKEKLNGVHCDLIEKMKKQNSVSLHVRRGDYVTNANANAYHGVCSIEYYKKAVELISEKVNIDEIYLFSDDLKWCKENLRFDITTTLVENNKDEKAHLDLLLMSNCKHNIIANSSFSWWGAWLNNNLNKIVVGPVHWANDSVANTKDILPKTWIRI